MDDTSYSTPSGPGTAPGPTAMPGTPGPGAPGPARRRLTRSRSDRKVAGVCGGVATYLGIDPLILRVVVVVLTVFGGSGLLLYVAGWLLLPDEGEQHSEIERIIGRDRTRGPSVAAVVVTIVLLVALVGSLELGAAVGGHFWLGGPNLWPLIVIGGVVALVWYSRRDSTAAVGGGPVPQPGGQPAQAPYGAAPQPPAQPSAAPSSPAQPYQYPPGGPVYAATTAADAPTLVDLPVGAGAAGPPGTPWLAPPGPAGPPPAPRPVRERSVLGALTWWVALVAAGVMLLLDRTGTWHLRPVTFLAVLLAVAGIGLVVGAFVGRSRGLIALGIVLTVLTALVSAVPAVGDGRAGTVSWAPASLSAVPADGYSLAAGKATLDLSATALGAAGDVQAQVGAGKLVVIVPSDVRLVLHANVGLGTLITPDRRHDDGVGRTVDAEYGPVGTPRGSLTLRLDVGAGVLEVRYAQA